MLLLDRLRAKLRYSIRARLIAMTSLVVASVVIALTLVIALAGAAKLRQASEQQLHQGLEQGVALMSNFLEVRESNLRLAVASPLVEAMFNDPALAAVFLPSLRSYFGKTKANEPWISNIILLKGDEPIFDVSESFEFSAGSPGRPGGRERLLDLPASGVAVFEPALLNKGHERPLLVLKRPFVKDGTPMPGAFIVLVLHLDRVQAALFEHTRIGTNGFVALAAQAADGAHILPASIVTSTEVKADLIAASRQWRAFEDGARPFRSLVLQQVPLPGTPFAIIGVAALEDIRAPIANLILLSIAFGLLATAAGVAGAIVFAERLTRPVLELAGAAQALQKGNLVDPIVCRNEDEIGQLAHSLEASRQSLADLVAGLEQRVAERTRDLLEKTKEVARLLDNSGEGFLSFDRDLRVNEGYSRECMRIFGRDALDRPLPELLCPEDQQQREFLAETLPLVMASVDDPLRRDAFLALLPSRYQLGGRHFQPEYKLLPDGRMMLILTDISDEMRLRERLTQERRRLEFVVHALEERDDLLGLVQDFADFRRRVLPDLLIFKQDAPGLLAELYRYVHTYKGLFAQASLPTLPDRLHELETQLGRLRDGGEVFDVNDIKRVLAAFELGAPLEADLEVLRDKLGQDYFEAEPEVRIPVATLDALEAEIDRLCEAATVPAIARVHALGLIHQLRFEPLAAMLSAHFKAAEQLAQRQGKQLAPIGFEGDDPLIDPDKYGPFLKSLVHVFRNAVDHGLEDADTRLLADKAETGRIRVGAKASAHELSLVVADDGRGIDPSQLRRRAHELGLVSASDAETTSDEAALQWIFADGFTTRERVSDLSGRGVGLAAVRQELSRLRGKVSVESRLGQGTRFSFSLPYAPAIKLGSARRKQKPGDYLLAALPRVLRAFVAEGLELELGIAAKPTDIDAAALFDFVAEIEMGQRIGAALGLSVEPSLLLELARRFEPELNADEVRDFAQSVGAEIVNTLAGKATVYLTHLEDYVAIGTPVLIDRADRARHFAHRRLRGYAGKTAAGRFVIYCAVDEGEQA